MSLTFGDLLDVRTIFCRMILSHTISSGLSIFQAEVMCCYVLGGRGGWE